MDTIDIMKNIKLFRRPLLEDVFTPSTAAALNYVKRPNIDNFLRSEMMIPGKQLIVYGHSGSGKTSSVRNLLKDCKVTSVRTHCEKNTTFEQLLLNAFDELDVFVTAEKKRSESYCLSSNLKEDYFNIKASINSSIVEGSEEKSVRLLPPQLTPQKLAKFMGEVGIVWIIEDFHKVEVGEKKRIADVIKIFVDNANEYKMSKIICIGACESAKELVDLEPNLKSRVSEISVPLLHDDEIESIVRNGFRLMNISIPDSLVEKLVFYSDRLGACAHQMCMDICKGLSVDRALMVERSVEDDVFQYAVDGFVNRSSDSFKTIYEEAIKNEVGWYILKTISLNVNEKLSLEELVRIVNGNTKGKSFTKDQIVDKLNELMGPSINIVYYNSKSETYALVSPFWHRFLRLQFSIENANKKRKKHNANNKNLEIKIAKSPRDKIVDEALLKFLLEMTYKES